MSIFKDFCYSLLEEYDVKITPLTNIKANDKVLIKKITKDLSTDGNPIKTEILPEYIGITLREAEKFLENNKRYIDGNYEIHYEIDSNLKK